MTGSAWLRRLGQSGHGGALFVLDVVAGAVIAVLLLRWRHWIPLFLLAGFGAGTLGAFLIAITSGLFGIHADWSWYAWLAAVAEVAAIICAVYAAFEEGYLAPSSSQRLSKSQDSRWTSRSHSGPQVCRPLGMG
jgi:hypothetical protein